jgi:hypothetical protein
MVLNEEYGKMVAYRHPDIISVPLIEAISEYNFVDANDPLVQTARGVGISFGD